MGGVALTRGALFYLLKNRTYIGEIRHKDLNHPGRHPGIIDPDLFARVQRQLRESTRARTTNPSQPARLPFTGLVFDADGQPMSPISARGRVKGRIYRYYVSTSLQRGEPASLTKGIVQRMPAIPFEAFVSRTSRHYWLLTLMRSWSRPP